MAATCRNNVIYSLNRDSVHTLLYMYIIISVTKTWNGLFGDMSDPQCTD